MVQLVVVECKVLGSEEGLGLALLSDSTVLSWRHILGDLLLLHVQNRGRLGRGRVTLLDDRSANTRAAGGSLQFRGSIVGRLGAEGSASGGGGSSTRSGFLDASRLCGLRCQCVLASGALLRIGGLDRVVLCNIAHVSEGGTLAGSDGAIGGSGGGTLGSQSLFGRVGSRCLESSGFGTRQARGADVLGVLVSDSPSGNSRLLVCQQQRDDEAFHTVGRSRVTREGEVIRTGGIVYVIGSLVCDG